MADIDDYINRRTKKPEPSEVEAFKYEYTDPWKASLAQFAFFLLAAWPFFSLVAIPITPELRAYMCGGLEQASGAIRFFKIGRMLLAVSCAAPFLAFIYKRSFGDFSETKWMALGGVWILSWGLYLFTTHARPDSNCASWERQDYVAINELMITLNGFYKDCGFFPTSEQGLSALVQPPAMQPYCANWKGPYTNKTPTDKWNRPFLYQMRLAYPLITTLGKDGALGGTEEYGDLNSDKVRAAQ